MADEIKITNIATLSDLVNSFHRFSQKTDESLNSLKIDLKRTLESIQVHVINLQQKLEQKQSEVQQARKALEYCQSQEDEDYTPNCRAEEEELEYVIRRFETTKEDLQRAKSLQMKVENTISEFQYHIRHLKELSTIKIQKANAYLSKKIANIESYHAINPESVNNYSTITASIKNNKDKVITETQKSSITNSNSYASGQWSECRTSNFQLSNLSSPENIKGANDFKKVSSYEMKEGLKKLQKMKPVITQGIGNSKDYWASFDKEKGLEYSNGYQRVYEAFYGSEPIRIVKNGDKYEIVNGRHRVWLAKQLGIKTLPVVLVERK